MSARHDLKAWLMVEGRKQSWLAEKCLAHDNTVSAWMRGHAIPSAIARQKLAEITGLDIASEGAWK